MSVPIGRLCGRVAQYQMRNGLHFVNEQPEGSQLYSLTEWRQLRQRYNVIVGKFDQYMAGLCGRKTGLPIRKRTETWASDRRLTAPLEQTLPT